MHNCAEIHEIIKNRDIRTYYQPIVKLDSGLVIGYEALSRGPEHSELESPVKLIEFSEKCGMTWDLERVMRTLAIERAVALESHQYLFINVDPNIINDEKFERGMTQEVLRQYGISSNNVVMELTERSAIDNYEGFNKILQNYIEQGFKIAIDDAGEGYSGINRIIETRPHFLKLDMNIIRGLEEDSFKQAIVKSFVQLCQDTNIMLIAEGIETKEELKMLIKLNVYAGQGYYIQRPASQLLEISPLCLLEIKKYNQIAIAHNDYSHHYHYIGTIVEQVKAFHSTDSCKTVMTHVENNSLESICVTEDNVIVGLLTRSNMNQAMSGPYGHAVYFNREIGLLMDSEPLIVDYYMPIQKVAVLAMKREGLSAYDPIIVQKGSQYFGLVSVKKLLMYAMEYERNYARELNPLTQLPGNMVINRVLNDILYYPGNFFVLYFDLDNFKAYNDIYGFDNGDKVIRFTSKILQEKIKGFDVISSFVGHIGGDDFVAVLECTDVKSVESLISHILEVFDVSVKEFYSEEDRKKGSIQAKDRNGEDQRFPLVTLSIAGVYGNLHTIQSTEELGKAMASLKKAAKRTIGSSYELEFIS